MPIKLKDSKGESEIVLDIVKFINEDNTSYFRIENSKGFGLNIEYIPIEISTWDKDRFELYLFENPYLNAENDVFEVYESAITNERLGWIFPITILESNNNDFVDIKNLNDYKYIAYQKLLELDIFIDSESNLNEWIKLTNIFKNAIICLFSKDTIKKIANYNFEDYLLSFYDYGYFFLKDIPKSKIIYDKSDFIIKMRDNRRRIKITKSNYKIYENEFIQSLFKENLLQSESYIVRFVFLYQIIEYFMQLEFDKQIDYHIEEYKKNKLSKNELRENIIISSRERELINIVLSKISINKPLSFEFIQECNYLFEEIGSVTIKNLADGIYNIRNLITHRLRDLISNTQTLIKITEIFERVIINILINYRSEFVNN